MYAYVRRCILLKDIGDVGRSRRTESPCTQRRAYNPPPIMWTGACGRIHEMRIPGLDQPSPPQRRARSTSQLSMWTRHFQ